MFQLLARRWRGLFLLTTLLAAGCSPGGDFAVFSVVSAAAVTAAIGIFDVIVAPLAFLAGLQVGGGI